MNLLERARGCGIPAVQGLLQEMAGEVERLWALEKNFNEIAIPAWNAELDSLRQSRDRLEGEIMDLKLKTDVVGMTRKWLEGYRMAVSQFQPIMFNLLRACDTLPPEPTEEDDHDGSRAN